MWELKIEHDQIYKMQEVYNKFVLKYSELKKVYLYINPFHFCTQ